MALSSRPKTLRSLRPRAGKPAPRSRPARAGHATTADPITTEIILGAFETICYEMATHVSLTATTPILNQSNERNATILDGTGQLAALSVGIPQFMLSSTLPVRFAVEFFGDGGLLDGDVLVANDPYHGGGHLPDYNIFAPVFHDGEMLGALAVVKPRQGLNATEQRLVADVASQAGLVFSRFRLFEELRESRSRIVVAQDVERRRIERDLHDGAQQRFVNALLALGMVKATNHGQPLSTELIDQASHEVQAGLSELRALARGLHPPLLTESGLLAAVTSLADRSPIVTSVNSSTDRRYSESVEVTAYFVIAEALANAAKHSRASAIQVRIDEVSGRLHIEIRDDGVGGAAVGRGSGLVGLKDRTSAIGGTLSVQSASGHGTIVRAELPCE